MSPFSTDVQMVDRTNTCPYFTLAPLEAKGFHPTAWLTPELKFYSQTFKHYSVIFQYKSETIGVDSLPFICCRQFVSLSQMYLFCLPLAITQFFVQLLCSIESSYCIDLFSADK